MATRPNINKKVNKNSFLGIIIFMFGIMIVNAIAENLKGIFLPTFKVDFNMTDGIMGFWLFVGSLGYIVFTYIGGVLSRKIGQKKVMICGLILTSLACFLFFISHSSRIMIFVDLFLVSGGVSLSTIAINTLIPVVGIGFQAILMNLTHFFYGFGATIGTGVTGYLINKNVKWQKIYIYVFALYIILIFILIMIKVPAYCSNKDIFSETDNNLIKVSNKEIWENPLVYTLALALGFYVFAETATINWMVNYCEKSFDMSSGNAAKYLAIFTATLTLGRLVGGFIVQKVGELKSVFVATLGAIILSLLGIILGNRGLIIISMAGIFFSIIYPTLVVFISNTFKKDSAYVLGLIISIASAVSMVLNVVIGYLNQLLGATNGFLIIPVSLLISLVAQMFVKQKTVKG